MKHCRWLLVFCSRILTQFSAIQFPLSPGPETPKGAGFTPFSELKICSRFVIALGTNHFAGRLFFDGGLFNDAKNT
jgi:hypothetical protein